MKPEIQAKLETIFAYPFFQYCGKPASGPVISINSWPVAMKHFNSRKWENCCLMARNVLQRLTEKASWERAQEWNSIIDDFRPLVDAFVDKIPSKTGVPEVFVEKLKPKLSLDIMRICLEHGYRDLVEPPFFIPILDPWYAAGHLPCGWDGKEFPEGWDGVIRSGRLMVF